MVGHQGHPGSGVPSHVMAMNPGGPHPGVVNPSVNSQPPGAMYANPSPLGVQPGAQPGLSPVMVSTGGNVGPHLHPQGPVMSGPSPGAHVPLVSSHSPGHMTPGQINPGQMGIHPTLAGQPRPNPVPMQSEPNLNSVERIKATMPLLKRSLGQLMRLAAEVVRPQEGGPQRPSSGDLGRALEDFFALCDQLELHLGVALEGFNQVIQHKKYMNPEYLKQSLPPAGSTGPGASAGQSDLVTQYAAFTALIESQVALAASLHDALASCSDKVGVATTATTTKVEPQPGTNFAIGGLGPVPASNATPITSAPS